MHPLAAIAAAHSPPARDWSDDEREMMSFLLLGGSPSGVDEHAATAATSTTTSPATAASTTPAAEPPAAPVKTGGKAKLSALERRAKHREVVRRSYHRNKAVLTGLKDTVKQLEGQMAALEMKRGGEPEPQEAIEMAPAAAELKHQVDALAAQSAQLQSEAAQLQQTLHAHQNFVAMVYTASASSEDSSDEEVDSQQQPPPVSPWREPSWAETSDEDLSPDRRHHSKFYRSPRPAYAPTPTPCAPVEAARCKEIGYRTLSLAQARAFVGETYQGILSFSLSGRAVTTGARVMGWEDKRLAAETTVKFSLRKQFVGENASALMTETWQCFSDPVCADKKFRGLMTLHILQHLNEDTIVALRDAVSPDGATVFRCVYLLFRVRTRSGFIICSRSIDQLCVGERERTAQSRDGRAVHWVDLFSWFVFDQLGYADPSAAELFHETGAQVEYGGSVDFGDASLLPTIAMDTLSTVTRWESFMVKPSFRLPDVAFN